MAIFAMFDGLVYDESGRRCQVVNVGNDACYVVLDGDFRRHIDADDVDRQVLRLMSEQIQTHKDIAVLGLLQMIGKDDIFTKTAVEYSLGKLDQMPRQPLPPEAATMLAQAGFRIVIDDHGDVVDIEMPEEAEGD